jgi:hypothetical protein
VLVLGVGGRQDVSPTPDPLGESMANTDPTPSLSSLGRTEQLFLGGVLLTFICTFLPFDGISVGGQSASESAWHGIGVLACLLVVLVLVTAAVHTFAPSAIPKLPVSLTFIEAAGMALAVLFFVIRWLTLPSYFTVHLHLHWGGYVTLVVAILTTAVAVVRLRESGEAMPWENRGGAAPPADTPPTA